ncbi:hypothetical protein ACH47B_06650 [Rhodococcus sp. NPDC019627]|uniref:hypothetical protein n=1 Tax=unclassified Rhodococcus (in: high G+C Gram-positive bacteria) TaxID=192944 RepID=UPI00379D23CD
MNRETLMSYNATMGAWLAFVVLCVASVVVVLAAVIVVIRVLVELVAKVFGIKRKPREAVAVPFGGPGAAEASAPMPGAHADMPPGLEKMTPAEAMDIVRKAQQAGLGTPGAVGAPDATIRPFSRPTKGDDK